MRLAQPGGMGLGRAVLAGIAALCAGTGPAAAWGTEGHRLIAAVAERHLSPTAAEQARALLAAEPDPSLAGVSSWADAHRAARRETGRWHYVDIPHDEPGFDAARDCPTGDCVVVKLQNFAAQLADAGVSAEQRAVALKWVVHLVGDLHQPLHTTERDQDRGGNETEVLYRHARSNLHRLWDTDLVVAASATRRGGVGLLDRLHASVTPGVVATMVTGTPLDWLNETHGVAVEVAYGRLPANLEEHDLAHGYAAEVMPAVHTQLLRAGLRLAAMLNAALR